MDVVKGMTVHMCVCVCVCGCVDISKSKERVSVVFCKSRNERWLLLFREREREEEVFLMCLPCVPGDSDKLNYIRRFHLRCKPIFATASAASKMQLTAKMVKSDPIIWLLLSRLSLTRWYTLLNEEQKRPFPHSFLYAAVLRVSQK